MDGLGLVGLVGLMGLMNFHSISQRDYITQPRVAVLRYPGVAIPAPSFLPQRGCVTPTHIARPIQRRVFGVVNDILPERSISYDVPFAP